MLLPRLECVEMLRQSLDRYQLLAEVLGSCSRAEQ